MYDGVVKGQTSMSKAPNEIEEGYEVITDSDENYAEIKYLDRLPAVENTTSHIQYYTVQEGVNAANNGETL